MDPLSALAIANSVLARISDVQKHITSLKNRISKFRENPKKYEALIGSVDRLGMYIAYVADIFDKYPETIPTKVSVPFIDTLCIVRDTIQETNRY